jgi:hypothetical protein
MGAGGDYTALRASNSGVARSKNAGLSVTDEPAIRKECNYANEIDASHGSAGRRCCGGRDRRGTNGCRRAGSRTRDHPVHGCGEPSRPSRLPRRRRTWRRLPWRRLWRRFSWRPRRLGLATMGLEPVGLGPPLVVTNDDGEAACSMRRFPLVILNSVLTSPCLSHKPTARIGADPTPRSSP